MSEQDNAAQVATQPDPAQQAQQQATPSAEPFLTINERTSYKTKDDAVHGWQELQESYTKLSGFRALLDEGYTPEEVTQYLNELAEIKQQQQAAQAAAATQQSRVDPDSLPQEWKDHISFLKKTGQFVEAERIEKLAEELKGLKEQVAATQQNVQQESSARTQAAARQAESMVIDALKEQGIPAEGKTAKAAMRFIRAYASETSYDGQGNLIPNSPEDRFMRGGPMEQRAVISEVMKEFFDANEELTKTKEAAYLAKKNAAQAAQPRNLPQSSGIAVNPQDWAKMTPEQRRQERVRKLKGLEDQFFAGNAVE